VVATYVLSLAAGIAMVSSGNAFALERRDAIVGAAQSSEILVANRASDNVRAALLDFTSNLVGGFTGTVAGITVIGSYPIVAYRVGGIVSVDTHHESRLEDVGGASYYVVTLVLQLIPYSIADGMGVYLGVGAWRAVRGPRTGAWFGLPTDRLRDVALAYIVVAPLSVIASLWEFVLG
jgi:hypothetical protein